MLYFCDGKKLDFNDSSFKVIEREYSSLVGEGTCYEKDKFVYKIHFDEETLRKNIAVVLQEDACKMLKLIKTKRMFLPIALIMDDEGNYSGYKTEFIEPLKENDIKIVDKEVDIFFQDIQQIKKDLNLLSEVKFVVHDFGIHNMIDNGHINIFDPGRYEYNPIDMKSKDIYQYNQAELEFLVKDIINSQLMSICGLGNLYKFHLYIKNQANISKKNFSYLEMLEKMSSGYESINQFSKDLCKTKILKL